MSEFCETGPEVDEEVMLSALLLLLGDLTYTDIASRLSLTPFRSVCVCVCVCVCVTVDVSMFSNNQQGCLCL